MAFWPVSLIPRLVVGVEGLISSEPPTELATELMEKLLAVEARRCA